MKKLETERLIIRPFEISDAEGVHPLFSDAESMRLVAVWPPLTTLDETCARVEEWSRRDDRCAVIEKETGAFAGYISVCPDSEEARADTREIGFAAVPAYRGKGYMKEAAKAVLNRLKEEGITYVWACCFKENRASGMLIRALGFELMEESTFDAPNDRTYESLEFRIIL